MAILWVDADEQSVNATGTSISVPKPTNLVNGDVVQLTLHKDGQQTLTAIPTDFIEIVDNDFPATPGSPDTSRVWRKVIVNAAGEPANYVIDWTSGSEAACAVAARMTGVDNTTPEDVTPVTSTGTSTTPVAPSITTVSPNTHIVAITHQEASQFHTPPSGMTERIDHRESGGVAESRASESIASVAQPAAGASGTKTFTATLNWPWATATIAYRESVAGGAVTQQLTIPTECEAAGAISWPVPTEHLETPGTSVTAQLVVATEHNAAVTLALTAAAELLAPLTQGEPLPTEHLNAGNVMRNLPLATELIAPLLVANVLATEHGDASGFLPSQGVLPAYQFTAIAGPFGSEVHLWHP